MYFYVTILKDPRGFGVWRFSRVSWRKFFKIQSSDSSNFDLIIPPPTKLCGGGGYWFHHGCLSVHPPVCLSVEKWFPHDNSVSFWHTMMILHTCIGFWGQKVGSQGQICTLMFASFPHDNSITFWTTMIILHTWVDHDPRRTFIDFGVNISKVKVKFGL